MQILGTLASSVQKVTSSFESIATATGTGSSGTITFSSIPSTYTHLQIRATTKTTSTTDWAPNNAYIMLKFNGAGTGYARHSLYGNGSTANSTAEPGTSALTLQGSYMPSGASFTNMMSVAIVDIHDYASTTKNKTLRSFQGTEANGAGTTNRAVGMSSGFLIDTNAITSISLISADGSWTTNTSFALYGIKGA